MGMKTSASFKILSTDIINALSENIPTVNQTPSDPKQTEELHDAFVPRRFLRGGHAQTIAGNFLPRESLLPAAEDRLIEVEEGTQVLCHCHWQPERAARPAVVIVHGLEGSSDSQYVIGNGSKAWAGGMNVVRRNMRTCGGTDHLSATLYPFVLSA